MIVTDAQSMIQKHNADNDGPGARVTHSDFILALEIAALRKEIAALRKEIAALRKEIAALRKGCNGNARLGAENG